MVPSKGSKPALGEALFRVRRPSLVRLFKAPLFKVPQHSVCIKVVPD